jgi:hypothetical protein
MATTTSQRLGSETYFIMCIMYLHSVPSSVEVKNGATYPLHHTSLRGGA